MTKEKRFMLKESYEDKISELFKEDIVSIIAREQEAFDRQITPYGEVFVLFGAGGLGKRTLVGLRQLGIEPLAFTDNNPQLWGTTIDSLLVLPPNEAVLKYGQSAVFIVTVWNDTIGHPVAAIETQLNEYGYAKVVSCGYLYWKYDQTFLPYFGLDLPHKTREQLEQILKASSLWADDASRKEFLAQLNWRLTLDFAGLPTPESDMPYFPDDLVNASPEEVFIDCGAFIGDTIQSFLGHRKSHFRRLIAIEPDPINLIKLKDYVSNLPDDIKNRITVLPVATGNNTGKVRFNVTGTMQANVADSGNFEVDCFPLDELLQRDDIPTYIKIFSFR